MKKEFIAWAIQYKFHNDNELDLDSEGFLGEEQFNCNKSAYPYTNFDPIYKTRQDARNHRDLYSFNRHFKVVKVKVTIESEE